MHKELMTYTKGKPMKQIDVGGQPYLQRYYIGRAFGHEDLWLHRFLGADVAEHLHNHPFEATSVVLTGQYTEEVDTLQYKGPRVRNPTEFAQGVIEQVINDQLPLLALTNTRRLGFPLSPFTWHRITRAEKDTWTLMIVEPARLPFWYFREPDGSYITVESSPRDWYKEARPR